MIAKTGLVASFAPRILAAATLGLAASTAAPLVAQGTRPAPASAAQSARQPMTAQDLVTLPRLGTPVVSPDAAWLVYPVTQTDPASYARTTQLWVRALDPAAKPVRVTGLDEASDARFGSDGWLYFLAPGAAAAGAEATSQIWRARIGPGGTATGKSQVSNFAVGVNGFALSPAGNRIAVWADIARDCPDFGCPATDAKGHLPGPGTGRLYRTDDGFVRHWDSWETPGTFSRVFVFDLAGGKATGRGVAADGPAGPNAALTGDAPTKPFGGGEEIAWAPDSRSLYFTARQTGRDEPRSTNLDIWRSDLAGGAPVNLTETNRATDALPTPSPDGQYLAYVAMARPGYEADRQVVQLRDLKTGAVTALTRDFDRSFGSLAWTPDSRWLIATAQDVLDTPVFRIDPRSGKVEKLDLMAGDEAHIGNVVPLHGETLVFTRDSIAAPPEMFLSRGWRQAVPLSDAATTRIGRLAPTITTRFSFAGAGGATVWGQITKPDGVSARLPAILYVHGGPQGSFNDAWSNRWNPRVLASQGYAVVSVDFHGSTGYGQAFVDSITNDWGGKPLEDLQKGLAAALKLDPQIDGDNACAMGASYGGYMMNWIQGRWPDRFKCLVNHNGVFDQRAMAYETEEQWFITWEHGGKSYLQDPAAYERWNPVNHVANWKTPMLIVLGERDFRIPYSQGLGAFTAMQERGIAGELLVFPDENHWVLKPKNSLQWHDTVFGWLARHLK